MSAEEKLNQINEILYKYAQIDGAHHKMWCLDQIARIVNGDNYDEWVYKYQYFDDNGNKLEDDFYEWDCGIAP